MSATPEGIGTVAVNITANQAPLVAALGQAQSTAAAAGTQIAGAFTAAVAPAGNAARAAEGLSAALAGASRSQTQFAASTNTASAALGHQVTQIQATSGALRVLEGSGGLRAAERFLANIPGVGAALTNAFPLVGLIAVGELISRAVGHFTALSEQEKQAKEDAKQFTAEVEASARKIASLNVEIQRLNAGAVGGAGQSLLNAKAQLEDAQRKLQEAQGASGTTRTVGGRQVIFPAHPASDSVTPQAAARIKAGNELLEAQKQVQIKTIELANAETEARNAAWNKQISDAREATAAMASNDEDGLASLKASHALSVGEVIAYWQKRLAAESSNADRVHQIGITLGNLYQEQDKVISRIAEHGQRLMDEQIKKAQEYQNKLTVLADEAQATLQAVVFGPQDAHAAAGTKIAETNARSGGELADQQALSQKLAIQRQYGAILIQTNAQQVAALQQEAALDEQARQAKISGLDAERSIAQAAEDTARAKGDTAKADEAALEVARLNGQIDVDRVKSANDLYQAHTKILELQKQQSLAGQLARQVAGIPGALGGALAGGIVGGRKDSGIGKEIEQSLRNVGQQLLGTAFTKLISTILLQIGTQTGLIAATTTNAGVTTVHAGVMATHAGVMLAHAGVMIGNTIATIANSIATLGNTIWLVILAAVEAVKAFFGFADGGRPPVGVPSMVGERGPELFVPDVPGTIFPNGSFGGGTSSTSYSAASSMESSSSLHIGELHAHGMSDAHAVIKMVARDLPAYLKSTSSVYSPAGR